MRLLIIIPTYNEAENIELLIRAVFSSVSSSPDNVEILVIDDNSPDGTAEIVRKLINQYTGKIHLQCREGKQGCASAFLKGFSWGVENNYDYMLAMDADFSHDPKYIPQMLEAIKDSDIVVGSRNVKGGMIENRTFVRNLITKCASIYCRVLLSCPIHDFTGGYNMYRKEVFQQINSNEIQCRGYSFQIEIKYKSFAKGFRIKEIPIIFPDRRFGKSKMSKSFLFKALLDVWKIKKIVGRDTTIDQFIKFAITGGLGTITNLLIFFLCVDKMGFPPIPVSIFCFFLAGTQNYIINHKWSFRQNIPTEPLSIKRWALFLSGALIGLAANISVMHLIVTNFVLPYKTIAQACGILAGMFINFIISKMIVFRKRRR
jgi:dolichol-phosphate mannosyltransferase